MAWFGHPGNVFDASDLDAERARAADQDDRYQRIIRRLLDHRSRAFRLGRADALGLTLAELDAAEES